MANWYGLGAGTPGNWRNASTIADIAGPGSSPMLTPKEKRRKEKEDVTEKEDGHHVPRKAQQSTLWYNPLKEQGNGDKGEAAMLLQWAGYGTPLPSPPASSSHPTPTQPAWLAQQSLRSRRFRAIII